MFRLTLYALWYKFLYYLELAWITIKIALFKSRNPVINVFDYETHVIDVLYKAGQLNYEYLSIFTEPDTIITVIPRRNPRKYYLRINSEDHFFGQLYVSYDFVNFKPEVKLIELL
jgi:hypothetical protein